VEGKKQLPHRRLGSPGEKGILGLKFGKGEKGTLSSVRPRDSGPGKKRSIGGKGKSRPTKSIQGV